MKTLSTSLKALVVASLAFTAGFAAAVPVVESQTLAVTASVTGMCKFSVASTPLAFGAIDPSLDSNKIVSADVKYKCTKGTTAAVVTATGGMTRTMTGLSPLLTADKLAYTLAFVGATQVGAGFGSGKDLTLVVTGTITPAQYNDAAAGSYSEDVTLNITP